MVGYNVFVPRHSPFGYPLEHAVGYVAKRAKEAYKAHSAVYKRSRLDDIGSPSKRLRTEMPVRKRTRFPSRPRRRFVRRARRRFYRRKRYARKGIAPLTQVVKARTCMKFDVSAAGATLQTHLIRMNDVSDPLGSNGTAQPLYYDQWAALYDKAIVLGAKLTAYFENEGTTAVMFGCVKGTIDEAGMTNYDNYEHFIERGSAYKLVTPENDRGIITSKVSIKKHMHKKDLKDDPTFHCDLSSQSSPTSLAYFVLWFQSLDKATTNAGTLMVVLEHVVLLTNRKEVSQSAGV